MKSSLSEIPQTLAGTLRTIGPIHHEAAGDYLFSVRVVLGDEGAFSEFLIEQRIAERSLPAAAGQGLAFKLPVQVGARAEATFVFAETLDEVLHYMRRQGAPEA